MLEIPACNAGAYREYLVCHETLQDRPCLRLPVCGETAVLCSLLSAFLHPPPPPPSFFHPPCRVNLLLSPLVTAFCEHRALILPSSRRHLSITSCEHLRIKRWKIPPSNAEIFARVCIYLQCCRLSRRLSRREIFTLYPACAGIAEESFQVSWQRTHGNVRVPTTNVISDVLQCRYPVNFKCLLSCNYRYISWCIAFNGK